ncbi:MAG: topoisomerase protein [Parcubacteria group bacterium GW2011_GWE2_39_37]|uniref:DNA topoisomerase 1 n=1 Tax=Candidatus Falkowbacteria bacterium GW2011_GWF2_39_8 TaxID=1618642 RepID=A0A0G0SF52_9BACT|nr:MAG: topoisomerase protein [Parcubacteria group bacterium GW2011_GWE2_39_37]KKR33345.1 MAG: topoisomerase protein [Candidatus Falkowbacteria bacterium GW2011_GWF2_39_8]
MNLVIVESPTKAKTIGKFLKSGYKIESSFGHIRDLPKGDLGVDVENNYQPKYVIPTKSRKLVTSLKKLAAKADKVILASDEDREGEAIAWHLAEALDLNKQPEKIERIAFHEITEGAIREALAHPRAIDMPMVNAQQARRILDRLVGYKLSPFLWKKVVKGLSAGRVQSVAVRLTVDREREIQKFEAQEYWGIEALLKTNNNENFSVRLNKLDGKVIDKFAFKNQAEADDVLAELKGSTYLVKEVKNRQTKKSPPKPFTTSSLQQTANRMLGYSAKQTMMLAQQLYEGIDLAGEGHVGLITYMRTDSLNLSEKFLNDSKEYLEANLGEKYSLKTARIFKTKSKGAQEAHEAIRPSEANRHPDQIKDSLNSNQYRLYKLIWQRAVASQMPEAIVSATDIDVDAIKDKNAKYQFRASGQTIEFDGYLKIYPEKSAEIDLPKVKSQEELSLEKINAEQHFTKPPARYSDAGLVKALERYGIGRPSTYAPTIATIEARNYVERDEAKRLKPTDIAFTVNDLLVAHFPNIVDFDFTAKMENELDEIAKGSREWQPVIGDFYVPFSENLEIKYKEVNKDEVVPEEKTEEICEKCGSPMIIKTGRFGKFLACSNFPECRNIKSIGADGKAKDEEKSEKLKQLEEKYKDEVCSKCGTPMIVKTGRFGPFLACGNYPKCKNIKGIDKESDKTGIACPVCGKGEIMAKRSRRGVFYACNQYPDCKTSFSTKPTGEKCPECGALVVEGKNEGEVKCSAKGCSYKK